MIEPQNRAVPVDVDRFKLYEAGGCPLRQASVAPQDASRLPYAANIRVSVVKCGGSPALFLRVIPLTRKLTKHLTANEILNSHSSAQSASALALVRTFRVFGDFRG
jgi:hypothetical protein